MKEFIKNMLSDSGNVSSKRIMMILMVFVFITVILFINLFTQYKSDYITDLITIIGVLIGGNTVEKFSGNKKVSQSSTNNNEATF